MMEVHEEEEGGIMSCGGASEEGFDEELSVLPRHTKVIVTGNNRTKSVLVGLHGVVKKAVGLGGWHWLVLTNGLEVKLQRNALSVLEPPTGLEQDDNDSDEGRSIVEDYQKPFKARVRPQKPNNLMRGAAHKWQVADASSTGPKSSQRLLKVNLSRLETAALLRYMRRFELVEAGPNSSKEQLLDAVERHFSSQGKETVIWSEGLWPTVEKKKCCGKLLRLLLWGEVTNTDTHPHPSSREIMSIIRGSAARV